MKKIHLWSISVLCISLLKADIQDIQRGSIITHDNQVMAYSTAEGKRIFPFEESFSPALGYVSEEEGGKRGIEQATEEYLSLGYDVHLNVDLKLQQNIETIIDQTKQNTSADDIIAAVMESKTGKVLAMASSNRYDPGYIRKKDVHSIPVKFTEYPYEPGSVMMPFTLAIALEQNLITLGSILNMHSGKMEVDKGVYIKDAHKYDVLSAANTIVKSSYIGSAQISLLMSGNEFRDGLTKFGFGQASGIEFSRDLAGRLRSIDKFEQKLSKISNSFGYGMLIPFTQLLKAYNVFNNEGISVTPTIISHITDEKEKSYLPKVNDERIISSKTVKQMHSILVSTIGENKEVSTKYAKFELGGKLAIANISKNGRYVKEYHSSFYGFANDNEGNKYTIGVLAIRPKVVNNAERYRASFIIFNEIVNIMEDDKVFMP